MPEDEDDAAATDATLRLAIDPPVKLGAGVFSELVLREPRVSEVQKAEAVLGGVATPESVLDSEVALVSLVSEPSWPIEALQDLPVRILDQATEFVTAFGEAREETAGETLEIELATPVEVAKGSFRTLTLREPKVSERKRASQHLSKGVTTASMRRFEITLVGEITGWPQPALLKLPISTFVRAAGVVLVSSLRWLHRGDAYAALHLYPRVRSAVC